MFPLPAILDQLRSTALRAEAWAMFLEAIDSLQKFISQYQRRAGEPTPVVPGVEKAAFLAAVDFICAATPHQHRLVGHPHLQKLSFSLCETGELKLRQAGRRLYREFRLDQPATTGTEAAANAASPSPSTALTGEVETAKVFSLASRGEPFLILAVKEQGFRRREYRLKCQDPKLWERLRQAEGQLVTVRGQVAAEPGEAMAILHVQSLEE